MGHFNSQGCGEGCCCTGRIYEDGCFIRWEATNADAGRVLFDSMGMFPVASSLEGLLNNPATGLYTFQLQCAAGGEWTDAGSVEWTQRTSGCCNVDDPTTSCFSQLVTEIGVTGWLLTVEVLDPTNAVFTSGAITQMDGTYSLTVPSGWGNAGDWVYFGESLPNSSVTWPAWTCGGMTNPPRFNFYLTASRGGSEGCRMLLWFNVFDSRTVVFSNSLTINRIECSELISGTGRIGLRSLTCADIGPQFNFTLEAVT